MNEWKNEDGCNRGRGRRSAEHPKNTVGCQNIFRLQFANKCKQEEEDAEGVNKQTPQILKIARKRAEDSSAAALISFPQERERIEKMSQPKS